MYSVIPGEAWLTIEWVIMGFSAAVCVVNIALLSVSSAENAVKAFILQIRQRDSSRINKK